MANREFFFSLGILQKLVSIRTEVAFFIEVENIWATRLRMLGNSMKVNWLVKSIGWIYTQVFSCKTCLLLG